MLPEPATGARRLDAHGIKQVYVPAGTFLMGSTEQEVDEIFTEVQKDYKEIERERFIDQLPQHRQTIARGFWLDLTPVTNGQYARFVEDNGYSRRELWTDAGWEWLQDPYTAELLDYAVKLPDLIKATDLRRRRDESQPLDEISWFEATAYSNWRGGRLPTEAEWEWAARGPKNLIYPWGNEFDPTRLIYGGIYGGRSNYETREVGDGIRTAGASWVGVLDMSGNVWEWVNSLYRPYPYNNEDGREDLDSEGSRVLRGGDHSAVTARVSYRYFNTPRASYGGFRVLLTK